MVEALLFVDKSLVVGVLIALFQLVYQVHSLSISFFLHHPRICKIVLLICLDVQHCLQLLELELLFLLNCLHKIYGRSESLSQIYQ